ncbi:MAG: DUF2007 domain-containing protein [Verrucomicrobiae bacterium]|nr:DUF2007 domain-containing protein [Verrucomicrobiae bacterium]
MKFLRASTQPGDLERLKDVFEDAGIKCFIRNEAISGLAGELPFGECTPELWIFDDTQLAHAQEILRDMEKSFPENGKSWECPSCKEIIEPQFASCWNCGRDRQ